MGTLTKYKCARWETRTKSHPLQYTIRYMIPYRLNDRVTKLREVHSVTWSLDQCD